MDVYEKAWIESIINSLENMKTIVVGFREGDFKRDVFKTLLCEALQIFVDCLKSYASRYFLESKKRR